METRLAPFAVPSSTLGKVFLHHPALGETDWQHQRRALHFGASMITAGVACVLQCTDSGRLRPHRKPHGVARAR